MTTNDEIRRLRCGLGYETGTVNRILPVPLIPRGSPGAAKAHIDAAPPERCLRTKQVPLCSLIQKGLQP